MQIFFISNYNYLILYKYFSINIKQFFVLNVYCLFNYLTFCYQQTACGMSGNNFIQYTTNVITYVISMF